MRNRDTFNALLSAGSVVTDAVGMYGALILAWWIRFESGWIPIDPRKGIPPTELYLYGSGVATLLYLLIYRSLDLYKRPQTGTFVEQIPRIVRANAIGMVLSFALASMIRTEPPYSRLTVILSFLTTTYVMALVRFLVFRMEIALARRQLETTRVAIIGTDALAFRLRQALELEPRLRSHVVAFFPMGSTPADPNIPRSLLRDSMDEFPDLIAGGALDQVMLTEPSMPHHRMVELINLCEKNLVEFHLVPDLFRLLTSSVAVQSIDGIPLLGVGRWPLDYVANRVIKRVADVIGASLALVFAAPVIAVAAVLIRRESPGPVFYRQVRCGENGRPFTLYKLRSMSINAEDASGPVWASQSDPRRTRVGAWLRRHNLDELPQLWNVLKGEMSLVGPRPERPHFVQQFKEDIGGYMWRHVYKPGMTGWAQVNGLRGNTDLRDRVKHDLYYLEYWSMALDFKILMMTLLSHENAY